MTAYSQPIYMDDDVPMLASSLSDMELLTFATGVLPNARGSGMELSLVLLDNTLALYEPRGQYIGDYVLEAYPTDGEDRYNVWLTEELLARIAPIQYDIIRPAPKTT